MLIADLEWHDGARSRRLAAPDPAPAARAADRARPDRERRHRARVHRLHDTYEDAWKKGLRDLDPANLYNVDYSLLGTARVEPLIRRIRNEMAAAGLRSRTRRASATSASTRSTSATARRCATADDHAIYKNGAKEIAAQEDHVDHLHGEVQRARGQLVPHPLLAGGRRTAANAFGADQQLFDRFVAGQLACMREMTLMFAPYVNSYKRFVAGLVRADRGRLGTRQPDLLDARRRPRRGAAGREPAAGRRRQPVPGAERDDRRRPARDRQRAAARARAGGQRLHVGRAARPDQPLRGARSLLGERGGRARPSARRSSTTTSTAPRSSSTPPRRRSPTGTDTGASKDL